MFFSFIVLLKELRNIWHYVHFVCMILHKQRLTVYWSKPASEYEN